MSATKKQDIRERVSPVDVLEDAISFIGGTDIYDWDDYIDEGDYDGVREQLFAMFMGWDQTGVDDTKMMRVNHDLVGKCANSLLSAFEWEHSGDGVEYWRGVHERLINIISKG